MLIDLKEIKLHLRIDEESEIIDSELTQMLNAAIDYASQYLNFEINEESMNASIKSAILLIIGDLYANREGLNDKEYKANSMVERLLHFNRINLGV